MVDTDGDIDIINNVIISRARIYGSNDIIQTS